MKYPRLKDTVRIRRQPHGCVVYELRFADQQTVQPAAAYVLSLLSGANSPRLIEHLVATAFGVSIERAAEFTERVYRQFWYAIDFLPKPDGTMLRYDMQDFAYHAAPLPEGGKASAPEQATLSLTNRCNFRCLYCFNSSCPEERLGLPSEHWLSALDELKAMGVPKLELTGGEALMHPGFDRILDSALDSDALTYLFTNGALLKANRIARIAAAKNLLTQISLDSLDPDRHHRLTGTRDTFLTVTRNLQALVDAGASVRVKALVMPETLDGVNELIAFCERAGVCALTLDVYDYCAKGRGDLSLRLDYADAVALNDRLLARDPHAMRVSFSLPQPRLNWNSKADFVRCGAGTRFFSLQQDGEYSLCDHTAGNPFYTIGHYPEMSIRALWASDRPHALLHPGETAYEGACARCERLQECRSGCFAAKLLCTNRPYGPDPRCPSANYPDNPYK